MPKSLYIDPVKVREPGYIHFEDIPVCQYNKTIKQELEEGNYTKEDLIRIYRDMAICREFEHMLTLIKTQANYNGVETTYPGPAHLSLGQEASCVGEAYLLTKDDITFGSHRSHSEILSKGLSCINKLSDEELMSTMENFLGGKTLAAVKKFADTSDVKELAIRFLLYGTVAEIFARENGFHHGMGGSMHAFFLPFGIYPNNAIVGGSAPIATGAALYQKNNDKKFDFTKDAIDAYVDGEWVTADGTTLGADNGIGAAAILAVLEDDSLVHGPLEALFTATEETGMDGAFGLKKGLLHGDILLNLDSETEGELYEKDHREQAPDE